MRSRHYFPMFLAALVAAACQPEFTTIGEGNVALSDLPSSYVGKPDMKAMAKVTRTGARYWTYGQCRADEVMADTLRRCRAEFAEACEIEYLGPYALDGMDLAMQEKTAAEYQARFDQTLASTPFSPDRSYDLSASIERNDAERRMVVGALLIDFAKLGCQGEMNVALDQMTCTGNWDYEGRPRPDTPYPQMGQASLTCSDGRSYAGDYAMYSDGFGRTLLTAADGSTVRALFSFDEAIRVTAPEKFDRTWDERGRADRRR